MLLASGKTPKELIEAVCSPGGTTIEGMKVLEASDIGSVLLNAVSAATEKSRKLSK
jgi:pyrroline-5-carboxylate reductase